MDTDESSTSPNLQSHGSQSSRGRPLYPAHLSRSDASLQDQKRVPLHRRGKSRTYERLEDLLREAGYAETRIFTPEAERLEAQAERRERERRARGANAGAVVRSEKPGGVMNFLTGLVGSNIWTAGEENSKESHSVGGKPPGSLSWGRAQGRIVNSVMRRDAVIVDPSTPTPKTGPLPGSRPLTAPTHGERKPFTPVIITTPPPNSPKSSDSKSTSFYSANLYAGSSTVSLTPPSSSPAPHTKVQSRATAALRHMISTPNIPQRDRPWSSYAQSPIAVRRSSEAVVGRITHRHSTTNMGHPLPTNWLQTVAQAVLRTGPDSGAYVGGPRGRSQHVGTNSRREISTSSIFPPSQGLPPRPHTTKPAMGVVTFASVTCHSAPGSRSSSLVRTSDKKDKPSRKNSINKKRRNSLTRVPSLGVTSVELDSRGEDSTSPFSSSTHAYDVLRLNNQMNLTNDDDDDDDDDADPEPDFTALLMPAKRQNSIRSLRRHLHKCQNERAPLGRQRSVLSLRANSSNISNGASNSNVISSQRDTRSATSSMRHVVHAQLGTNTGPRSSRPTSRISGEFDADDSFEVSLAQDLLRSRRGSVDEGDGLADWPGLLQSNVSQGKRRRERGAMPAAWRPWAQT